MTDFKVVVSGVVLGMFRNTFRPLGDRLQKLSCPVWSLGCSATPLGL